MLVAMTPPLYRLSGFSTHFLSLGEALLYADRARGVKVEASDDSESLLQLRRLMRLDLTGPSTVASPCSSIVVVVTPAR